MAGVGGIKSLYEFFMFFKCLDIRLFMIGQSKIRIRLFVQFRCLLNNLLKIFILLLFSVLKFSKYIVNPFLLYGA